MAWTAPTTRTTGELITASIWNTDIVDNLNILKSPPSAYQTMDEESEYQTTSTSWASVDATDLSKSITLAVQSDIFVFLGGALVSLSAAGSLYFNLLLDGATDVAEDNGITGLIVQASTIGTSAVPLSFTRILPNLDAGPHTLVLRWKVVGSTTATLRAINVHPQFIVREVS